MANTSGGVTMTNVWNAGDYASTKGYFDQRGDWQTDTDGNACGLVVDVQGPNVTLEFAAGNRVTLGYGLLFRPDAWEVVSWRKMRREAL